MSTSNNYFVNKILQPSLSFQSVKLFNKLIFGKNGSSEWRSPYTAVKKFPKSFEIRIVQLLFSIQLRNLIFQGKSFNKIILHVSVNFHNHSGIRNILGGSSEMRKHMFLHKLQRTYEYSQNSIRNWGELLIVEYSMHIKTILIEFFFQLFQLNTSVFTDPLWNVTMKQCLSWFNLYFQ